MKKRKIKSLTLLYLYNFLILLSIVLTTGTICLYVTLHVKQKDMDMSISNMSSMVAGLDDVRELLSSGQNNESLQKRLDNLVNSFDEIDILVICDKNSVRYYHTDSSRIGEHFKGNDQLDILMGADPYISEAEGTLGMQRRSFHAVYNDDGEILGFVIASVLKSRLTDIRRNIIYIFIVIFFFLMVIGNLIIWCVTQKIRGSLLGYHPEEISRLYIEKAEVLDHLDEGICAIDEAGNITLMNQAARKILQLPMEGIMEGRNLASVYPETKLPDILQSGQPEYNVSDMIKMQNVLSTRIPIYNQNKLIGAVAVLRDKTEVTMLAEELTGAKYMVDTLRAFNHEFMNKLHIILGLLEIEDVDRAKDYIMETSLVSGKEVSEICHLVPHQNLAALLIGKLIRASELGISFSLKSDSYFQNKDRELPVDCYVTLVGNLVENALDELNSSNYSIKKIELGIYSGNGHTMITCDDTGGGIPEEILFRIYDRHTTTKGDGHGNGFAIIREIVDCYEGTVHIDTEKGMGTSIEISLPI